MFIFLIIKHGFKLGKVDLEYSGIRHKVSLQPNENPKIG